MIADRIGKECISFSDEEGVAFWTRSMFFVSHSKGVYIHGNVSRL